MPHKTKKVPWNPIKKALKFVKHWGIFNKIHKKWVKLVKIT